MRRNRCRPLFFEKLSQERLFPLTTVLLAVVNITVALTFNAALAADVEVELSSGEKVQGQWTSINGESISIGDPVQPHELSQVISLRPLANQSDAIPPAINLTLVDGSNLRITSVISDESDVTATPVKRMPIGFPLEAVRSIRFRPSAAATDAQWLGLFEKELRSDLLVIRRANDQLDPVEGVILSISAQTVNFELDGDEIEAPVERLEGVLFRNILENSSSGTRVETVFGSSMVASRIRLANDGQDVQLTLQAGVQHDVPVNQIKRIQFASARQMLASQPPASKRMQPYLKTGISESLFDAWFAPSSDKDDILAAAGGEIEYRIESGFENFTGSVSRASESEGKGKIKIQIVVDDEVRWEQDVQDSELAGFQISVAGARRIKLSVQPTNDGDIGDLVRFFKPRLLK
ncbi:NPCBM/NEW2 domain-containing protein [Stieleria sp. JC731]|uniref:NPCBM/NEW2 domain-containing protein n=1 Tax=Pirellulaceae TaxID=2691357 RepID=UPI001E488EE4|nr:NPCBM/NEW2 domain-containing protein [Stieleria sp. JC731]MCC9602423.1 NPCBM/NEW2 domain-containing protein [Stieleria sp. JC731]